jgi:hypothetical protein
MAANPFVGRNLKAPASIGGAQAALVDANAVWDTEIRPTAGTLVSGNSMVSYGVGVSMAINKRVLIAIPVRGHFTVAHLNFELSSSTAGGFNLVVLPIVSELFKLGDFSDISADNIDQSAVDAWDSPPVQTTGPGTDPGNNADNDHRAVFAIATDWLGSETVAFADIGSEAAADHVVNPSTGTLAAVFNRARKAAIEQGAAYATIMLVHEDESLASSLVTFRGLNGIGEKPSIGGVASAMPYDGLVMAMRPKLGLPTTTTIDCQLFFGALDWSAPGAPGSTLTIEYSSDPADLPAGSAMTGGTAIAAYTITGAETLTGHADFQLDTATQGRDASGFWHYRVKAVIAEQTYYGPTRPIRPKSGKAMAIADPHQIVAMNGVPAGAAEALQVQDATYNRIRSLCDGTPANHPSFIVSEGDGWAFCQTTAATIWPILEDGSGLSDSGTEIIARRKYTGIDGTTDAAGTSFDSSSFGDWTDIAGIAVTTDYVVVIESGTGATPGIYQIDSVSAGAITLTTSAGANATDVVFRVEGSRDQVRHTIFAQLNNSVCPFELAAILEVLGNHAPYHAHGRAINNGLGVNITEDVLAVLIEFQLIPPASIIPGFDQPVGHEGKGHYAFTAGENDEVQVAVMNAGIDSLISTGWTSGTYPIALADPSDWQLHDDVRDWRNGLLGSSPADYWDEHLHNALVGASVGQPSNYDRSGVDQLATGYRSVHLDPQLRASKFVEKCKCNLGHDHNDEVQLVGGITYHWLATPGDAAGQSGQPYSLGFNGPLFHRPAVDGTLGNAGFYRIDYSAGGIVYRYVATIISTTPTDYTLEENWTGGEYPLSLPGRGFTDGDGVRSVTVPQDAAGQRRMKYELPRGLSRGSGRTTSYG